MHALVQETSAGNCAIESADVVEAPARRAGQLPYALLTLVAAGACIWPVANHLATPVNDAPGFQHMLHYFLQSGRVDFMRWCQPLFVGVLPVAAPWALAFGTGTTSLSILGIAWSVGCILALFAFASRFVSPALASLLTLSAIAFPDFLGCSASFMTDIPYLTLLAVFLWFHVKLASDNAAPRGLWIGWCATLLLSATVRPFVLIAIPILAWCAWRGPADRRPFHRKALLASLIVAFFAAAVVSILGINRFSPLEMTTLREIFVQRDWARFNLRSMAGVSLITVILALPATLLATSRAWRNIQRLDLSLAAVATCIAAYLLWRGRMEPVASLFPPVAGVMRVLTVVAVPVAVLSLLTAIRRALDRAPGSLSLFLIASVLFQIAVLPIMQHPMLRYGLPIMLCVIALVAAGRPSPSRWHILASCALLVVFVGASIAGNRAGRDVNAAAWDAADRLVARGVPLDEIDGGWSWFCRYHLHPGQAVSESYVVRYHRLARSARYVVTDAAVPPEGEPGRLIASTEIHTLGIDRRVNVFDRGSAESGGTRR